MSKIIIIVIAIIIIAGVGMYMSMKKTKNYWVGKWSYAAGSNFGTIQISKPDDTHLSVSDIAGQDTQTIFTISDTPTSIVTDTTNGNIITRKLIPIDNNHIKITAESSDTGTFSIIFTRV